MRGTRSSSTEAGLTESAHRVGSLADLPPGSRKILKISGREIGVLNVDGRLYAIRNVCPHHGAPLCQGRVEGTLLPSAPGEHVYGLDGKVLRCPWHGYEFELETGRSLFDPEGMRVKTYRVIVEDDEIFVLV